MLYVNSKRVGPPAFLLFVYSHIHIYIYIYLLLCMYMYIYISIHVSIFTININIHTNREREREIYIYIYTYKYSIASFSVCMYIYRHMCRCLEALGFSEHPQLRSGQELLPAVRHGCYGRSEPQPRRTLQSAWFVGGTSVQWYLAVAESDSELNLLHERSAQHHHTTEDGSKRAARNFSKLLESLLQLRLPLSLRCFGRYSSTGPAHRSFLKPSI